MKKFSIIIPLYNESCCIENLIEEIVVNLKTFEYEIITVNDFSTDNTLEILHNLKNKYSLNIINNNKNLGQSLSIIEGIKKATTETIVTIDGDGQNNPKDIQLLFDKFSSGNYGLVAGIRLRRKDSLIKIISSRIANFIRSKYLDDDCKDTGCSLKVFSKKTFLSLPFFDGIHRFLPALFKGFGHKVIFISVDHRPRFGGKSKYGTFKRLLKGLSDMYRVKKIIKN